MDACKIEESSLYNQDVKVKLLEDTVCANIRINISSRQKQGNEIRRNMLQHFTYQEYRNKKLWGTQDQVITDHVIQKHIKRISNNIGLMH